MHEYKWGYPFIERQYETGLTGSVVELEFKPVPTGKIRVYDRMSFIDEDNAVTKVAFFIRGLGYDHQINEQNTLASNTFYWDDRPVALSEGMQLVVKVTGSTTNDDMKSGVVGVEYLMP